MSLLRFQLEPKIVYPIIANECRFALDESGYLVNDKAFILPSKDRAILGILNSKLANFYFAEVCAALEGQSGRYLEFRAQYVDMFPIAALSEERKTRTTLTGLVDRVITLHSAPNAARRPQVQARLRREIDATDRRIDQLVYELYGLTDDEVRLVEEATTPPVP